MKIVSPRLTVRLISSRKLFSCCKLRKLSEKIHIGNQVAVFSYNETMFLPETKEADNELSEQIHIGNRLAVQF